jgi:hypothetical protein
MRDARLWWPNIVLHALRPTLADQLLGIRVSDIDALAGRFAQEFFGKLHEHGMISLVMREEKKSPSRGRRDAGAGGALNRVQACLIV